MTFNITCNGVIILSFDGNDTQVFELLDATRYIIRDTLPQRTAAA